MRVGRLLQGGPYIDEVLIIFIMLRRRIHLSRRAVVYHLGGDEFALNRRARRQQIKQSGPEDERQTAARDDALDGKRD